MSELHRVLLPFQKTWASVHFDQLRVAAALLVLFEHARNLLFVDYRDLTAHRSWLAIPYALSSAGHGAVVLFFVLSGYFIGGTVLRALESGTWNWRDYLTRRLVRLWVVLLPALLLCVLWDRLGIVLNVAPALYAGQVANHMVSDVAPLLTPRVFFGNLFFLQGIATPVFGSDSALWSLAYEFWYYMLFPLAAVVVRRRSPLRTRIVCGLLLSIILLLVHGPILWAFPEWLAGVLLYVLPAPPRLTAPSRLKGTILTLATLVYFALFFLLTKVRLLPNQSADYLFTSLTLLYLWLLLSHTRPYSPASALVRLSRETARISYTLYAAHLPLLVLLTACTLGDTRWSPNARTIPYGLALTLIAAAYSYGLAWLTEFRTERVRLWIEKARSNVSPRLRTRAKIRLAR